MPRLEPTILDDFVRGDRARWAIQLLDDNDAPLNCTGALARFTIRGAYPADEVVDDSGAILALTTATPLAGLAWINEALGQLELVLSPAITKTMSDLCYLFDLQITTPAGAPLTLGVGTLEPDHRDITRSV